MQAINGYLENGRFIPNERVTLPIRTAAMLVIYEKVQPTKRDDDRAWLNEFHRLAAASSNEVLRDEDFPRMNLGRELFTFDEEG